MESIIKTKKPKGDGWQEASVPPPVVAMGFPATMWYHRETKLAVISAVEVASNPGEMELGPQYHVSISKMKTRCSRSEAKFVLKAFDMKDADEDNHVPGGFVRNFWKPVAEKFIGHVCPCKDEEPAMIEDKGEYIWRGV